MKEFGITKSLARKIRFGTRLAVLSICLTLLVGLSQAGVERPFRGVFHGFAEAPTETDVPGVVEIVVPLSGTATHLGEYEMRLVHYLNVNTFAFTGYTEWTTANGDQLYTTFVGQAYPTDDPAWITFDVTHTITGGTGRFEGGDRHLRGRGWPFQFGHWRRYRRLHWDHLVLISSFVKGLEYNNNHPGRPLSEPERSNTMKNHNAVKNLALALGSACCGATPASRPAIPSRPLPLPSAPMLARPS